MMDIRAKLRDWSLDRRLARNMASHYGVQFADYLLPLITIPYLTHVLGPATWGLVASSAPDLIWFQNTDRMRGASGEQV